MAPERFSGCRALHRASTLCASLDSYVTRNIEVLPEHVNITASNLVVALVAEKDSSALLSYCYFGSRDGN